MPIHPSATGRQGCRALDAQGNEQPFERRRVRMYKSRASRSSLDSRRRQDRRAGQNVTRYRKVQRLAPIAGRAPPGPAVQPRSARRTGPGPQGRLGGATFSALRAEGPQGARVEEGGRRVI